MRNPAPPAPSAAPAVALALAALLVGVLLSGCASGKPPPVPPLRRGAATACAEHWVVSWGASPSGVSTISLTDRTLRMIIAPHLGGSSLRIHLTNRYGTSPVTLGPVTVGVASGDGAALVPGSERAVTFSGGASVTIATGAEAVSDPVALRVRPFESLAISVYVPGTVRYPTDHFTTRQTSFMTPSGGGDHASATGGSAFTEKTTGRFSTGWYLLDGLDVLAPGATGAVVTIGDSITDGYQTIGSTGAEQLATINVNGRYPDDLERRLIAATIPLSVLNAGISGNQLLHSGIPYFGPTGLSRFGVDALGQAGVTDVIVLEGINDIGSSSPATASELIAAYERLIGEAHRAGIAIQLGTLTPTGGSASPAYSDAAAMMVREQVNGWIRGQRLSDGIVDFDAAVRDPADPSRIDPPYDGSDHVHFSLAGYQALANAVNLALLARPNCARGDSPSGSSLGSSVAGAPGATVLTPNSPTVP